MHPSLINPSVNSRDHARFFKKVSKEVELFCFIRFEINAKLKVKKFS